MRLPVSPILPASPRRRRRLGWSLLIAIAAGALALTLLLLPKGHGRLPDTFSSQPADVYRDLPTAKLGPADRRQIGTTLERFVRDGLGRRDPAAAYGLATPAMRSGVTRAEWTRGNLPVAPYDARPGDARNWRLEYAYGNEISVELLLQPGPREPMGAIVFHAALKKLDGRWLVDSVQPAATFARDGEKPVMFSEKDLAPGARTAVASSGRIDARWLLVPVAILALALLVPAVVVARTAVRRPR